MGKWLRWFANKAAGITVLTHQAVSSISKIDGRSLCFDRERSSTTIYDSQDTFFPPLRDYVDEDASLRKQVTLKNTLSQLRDYYDQLSTENTNLKENLGFLKHDKSKHESLLESMQEDDSMSAITFLKHQIEVLNSHCVSLNDENEQLQQLLDDRVFSNNYFCV